MEQTLFLGVPFNAGQSRQGTAYAPAFFRQHNQSLLYQAGWHDLGDITAPKMRGIEAGLMHAHALSRRIQQLNLNQSFLAMVGGDHGQGLGSVHGLLHHYPDLIVVWIDAHADANVPSVSPTGNMHGMPLAWLLGAKEGAPWWLSRMLKPTQIVYVGVRDIDPYERMLIEELGISIITPETARQDGLAFALKRELKRIDPQAKAPVHISFDVDALDAALVESTGTRVSHGLSFGDVETCFKTLRHERRIVSTEIVEINPELGSLEEAQELVQWSAELIKMVAPAPRLRSHTLASAFTQNFRHSLLFASNKL